MTNAERKLLIILAEIIKASMYIFPTYSLHNVSALGDAIEAVEKENTDEVRG